MTSGSMLSVDDARAAVLAAIDGPTRVERVALAQAEGRVLAEDLVATRDQPPFPASAMDGYALRAADLAGDATTLDLIGVSAAGRRFSGAWRDGAAVRIFTGSPVPDGCDAVAPQEDAVAEDGRVTIRGALVPGRHIRPAGLDFRAGETLIRAGRRLTPRDVALAASLGRADVVVRRKPRIALLATGDELVRPGDPVGPDQIFASNSYGLIGMIARAGAEPIDLGVAPDDLEAIARAIRSAVEGGAEALVTLGGASVGDHDLVRPALLEAGVAIGFWKVAMRPGRPLMYGKKDATVVLGLPGNPVSSMVCAILFILPLIDRLLGLPDADQTEPAILGADMPANDWRQDYVRARLTIDPHGALAAIPAQRQDSAMLRLLAQSDALILRPPHAPAAQAGAPCRIIRLAGRA